MMEDLERQLGGLTLAGRKRDAGLFQAATAPPDNAIRLVPLGTGLVLGVHSQEICRAARPVGPELATSAITLFSCAHSRQRREQREISKRELQEAVK